MPAQVETYAGRRGLNGELPWWYGTSAQNGAKAVILDRDDVVNAEEMVKLTGTDWEVAKVPLFVHYADGSFDDVPGFSAIQRLDNNKTLGVVSTKYGVFQNVEAARFAEALVSPEVLDSMGESHRPFAPAYFETGGSLREGQAIWYLVRVEKELRIKGDPSAHVPYIVVSTGHDGRRALIAKNTIVRIVCANTYSAAMRGAGAQINIRHSSNVTGRVAQAQKVLGLNLDYVEAYLSVANELASRAMSKADFSAFTEILIPTNPEAERPVRTEEARAELLNLFLNSATLEGVKPSAYRALQAVTEYVDHIRPSGSSKPDTKALSLLDGSGAALKAKATSLLVTAN